MTDLPRQFQILFATFPPPAGDLTAQLEAYAMAIDGRDLRDIDSAIKRFLRGEVEGHNPAFAPSAALVGSAVRKCMDERLDSERRAMKPALPPPDIVHSPESQARVKAMAAEAIANLAASMRTEDAKRDNERKQFMARVNQRFAPDQSEEALRLRLGFTSGDPEGDADVA
jgi:hypothetical protein